MVGSWDSGASVCLGIAELSQHGMAKRGGASYPVSAPHALTLNILRRTRASRGFPHAIFAVVVGTPRNQVKSAPPPCFTRSLTAGLYEYCPKSFHNAERF